jgi:hypothetical protein
MALVREQENSLFQRVPGLCGPMVKRLHMMMAQVVIKTTVSIHLLWFNLLMLESTLVFTSETPMLNHQFLSTIKMEALPSNMSPLEEPWTCTSFSRVQPRR